MDEDVKMVVITLAISMLIYCIHALRVLFVYYKVQQRKHQEIKSVINTMRERYIKLTGKEPSKEMTLREMMKGLSINNR